MAQRSIVIVGGGIIGSATAYFLTRHPNIAQTAIHLVESSHIAAGSSGKGGGFIAKDWHGASTASLGKLSFDLHASLAEEHDGEKRWGYRRLTTIGLDSDLRKTARKATKRVPDADWIRPVNGTIDEIGTEDTTAQVHPYRMTNALVELAHSNGKLEVHTGAASAIAFDDEGKPNGVTITHEGAETKIQASDVVFAAGPWTGILAKKLLGKKAGAAASIVPSPKSTSIVVSQPASASPPYLTPHALFTTTVLSSGLHAQPELYPRPDGTLYVCGAGMQDRTPLPEFAKDVHASEEGIERLIERTRAIVSDDVPWLEQALTRPKKVKKSEEEALQESKIEKGHAGGSKSEALVVQACYRPDSSRTGDPIIGKIGEGLWVASGHQVWGISLGPGTGKVMAELILDGEASSANIRSLQP